MSKSLSTRKLEMRYKVALRDGFHCVYCWKEFKYIDDPTMTLDHVIPDSQGGKFLFRNLILSCEKCNNRRGNCDPSDIFGRHAKWRIQQFLSIPHPSMTLLMLAISIVKKIRMEQ